MKLKKLLGITLLAIPLYFLAPNAAKAEEFTVNLKNPEVKIEQTEKTKKTNIVDDFDTIIRDLDFSDFLGRVNDRTEDKIYEKNFLLEVSPETRQYIFEGENATRYMNDTQRHIFMETVDKEIKKIITKEFKKEAQEDLKESRLYDWFKDETEYYRKRVKENLTGKVKVKEKEAYITDKGDINIKIKKEEFRNVPEQEKFKLKFRGSKISASHKKYFEFDLKAKPFSFHKWDYVPRLDINLTTKYFSIHNKTTYTLLDEKLKTSVSTTLPQGLGLSVDYMIDSKDKQKSLSTSLTKVIKDYQLTLSYSRTNYDDGNHSAGTVYFEIKKTW